jgi:hypothetical protein
MLLLLVAPKFASNVLRDCRPNDVLELTCLTSLSIDDDMDDGVDDGGAGGAAM